MAFLARLGMPTPARSIRREHVEAFIAAELERTAPSSAATRYRSLQQLFGWLDEEGEIDGSPMARTRPPKIPDKPVPVLPGEDVRRLLADCSGKDFRDRRDLAISRLFLDTGMRLEGMAGLRYSAGDPEASDVDLRSRVVRIIAKGRRELVLPIGPRPLGTLTGHGRKLALPSVRGLAWFRWPGRFEPLRDELAEAAPCGRRRCRCLS